LAQGSLWINSRLLAANAPAGTYTGLTIQGGTIALTSRPVNQGGKLMVPVNTAISLQLRLNQPEAVGVNPNTPFGIDARNLQLALPQTVSLQFGPQTQPIQELGNASCTLYGQSLNFEWTNQAQPSYDPVLQQIVVPFTASESILQIRQSESEFDTMRGAAPITRRGWALPVATIDLAQPTEAAGIGAILVQCGKGLVSTWQGLEGGGLGLAIPAFLVSPGQIFLADLTTGNPHAHQSLDLWKDQVNPFGTTVKLVFPTATLFFYVSNANGNELLSVFTNADFQIDRPVKVNGEPPAVQSLNSLLVIAVNASQKLIYLFDDNLIQDDAQITPGTAAVPEQFAIALTNALFKVSQPNGCLLFGALADDYRKVSAGFLFLTFGLYAYLPTLPDPYAANLGVLKRQIRGKTSTIVDTLGAATFSQAAGTQTVSKAAITAWLVCRVRWQVPAEEDDNDEVAVSFHFAPLNNQFGGISFEDKDVTAKQAIVSNSVTTAPVTATSNQSLNAGSIPYLNSPVANAIAAYNTQLSTPPATTASTTTTATSFAINLKQKPLPNYEEQWDGLTGLLHQNVFALLDISTNADLYGVSFNVLGTRGALVATSATAANPPTASPIQVRGMEVVSPGRNVKVFTVPQISWEPLINLTPPKVLGDPPGGVNYYPNDGGPMQILNSGADDVALAPLPLTDYLLRNFEDNTKDFLAIALMTLPFGLKALAVLQNRYSFIDASGATTDRRGSRMVRNSEEFAGGIKGSLQIQLNAGEATISSQSDMFVGSTIQLNNVLDFAGTSKGESTLGRTVTEIFNNEFLLQPFNLIRQRGVPLTIGVNLSQNPY